MSVTADQYELAHQVTNGDDIPPMTTEELVAQLEARVEETKQVWLKAEEKYGGRELDLRDLITYTAARSEYQLAETMLDWIKTPTLVSLAKTIQPLTKKDQTK